MLFNNKKREILDIKKETGIMYLENVPFCLMFFIETPDLKNVRYQIHLGIVDTVQFDLVENSIVGNINCLKDKFPMTVKEIHKNLLLTPVLIKMCKPLVYNSLISAVQRVRSTKGSSTVHLNGLPPYYDQFLANEAVPFVFLHEESPGPLRMNDKKHRDKRPPKSCT